LKFEGKITPESIEDFLEKSRELIFNQIPLPICFVDTQCRIITYNDAFRDIIGTALEDGKGKYAWELDPNAKFPIILETKKASIGIKARLNGKDIIVHRIPLFINGELVGGVSITIIGDLNYMYKLIVENNLIRDLMSFENKQCSIASIYKTKYSWSDILGNSVSLETCKKQANLYAKADFPVLITGESGVGKELFAHAIHNESRRRSGPFVKINCAAIPENLIEAELFGYEEGAFTGAAKSGRVGKFELANTGTIFLDEIGAFPLSLQSKLLRILQEKEMERVGSNKLINLDLRVIAATNSDLKEMILQGTFRSDLYYRLNVLPIEIPPLRERPSDIPVLVKSISEEFRKEYGIKRNFPSQVIKTLCSYRWPGNVRELKNVVERMMVISQEENVGMESLPKDILRVHEDEEKTEMGTLKKSVSETERAIIMDALIQNNFNKSKTAKALGIPRMTLYRKLKEIL